MPAPPSASPSRERTPVSSAVVPGICKLELASSGALRPVAQFRRRYRPAAVQPSVQPSRSAGGGGGRHRSADVAGQRPCLTLADTTRLVCKARSNPGRPHDVAGMFNAMDNREESCETKGSVRRASRSKRRGHRACSTSLSDTGNLSYPAGWLGRGLWNGWVQVSSLLLLVAWRSGASPSPARPEFPDAPVVI